MITTVCKISYGSQTVPPIVPAVQGDTGRAISLRLPISRRQPGQRQHILFLNRPGKQFIIPLPLPTTVSCVN